MILVDTHVAVWLTTEPENIGPQSRALCEQAILEREFAISAISFWEMAMLTAKGRLGAVTSPARHRRVILDGGAQELPVDGEVGMLAAELDGLHGDPADRIIVATAIVHKAMLVTADRALLGWKNSLPRHDAGR